ncbi:MULTISPECIES: YrrS family protein [Sutcliffiella]|uniref:DUF1510 domain-containing protein n=1 Tax=Sutcliffiella cohnii TaxID=33932 RepID=A0A223KT50_9BACI|nr:MULTISPECIES: YrrS family protein [Sutcliffiella]AST92671.1 hypothetical protein BC6307_15920 [Sutcliffiella cohnii]WBL13917.1 YrrS family protein [Sutcliffiella sp. NC1]
MSYVSGPRYSRTARKKKSNKIYNILIAIVFLLIIFFSVKLFFGSSSTAPATTNNDENPVVGDSQENKEPEEEETGVTEEEPEEQANESEEPPATEESNEEEEPVTMEEEVSDDETIIRTLTGNWAPVGTNQQEPHASVYDPNHVDWSEKILAINRALGVQENDYTLWFLGNGGNEHAAIARVTVKASNEHYRVYLQWVTNEGWKPVKLEQTVDKDM